MIKEVLKKLLPVSVRRPLKSRIERNLQKVLAKSGYTIARKSDYYSPLPPVDELAARIDRWNRPSSLKGISFDVDEMKSKLLALLSEYLQEFLSIPSFDELKTKGFGPGYTYLDALVLYLYIRHYKPRNYFEVGSGLSTYYCSLAGQANAREGHPLNIVCIEPYPYANLHAIPGIEIIARQVQDVDVSIYQRLGKEDIFFIDSSHIIRLDGDVPFLYLELLPILKKDVLIHIHDIPFPYNIPYPPEEYVLGRTWPMYWNEAMLVQAFLSYNHDFRIEMSTPIIRYYDEEFLIKNIPGYETVQENPRTFCSIWLQKMT